GILQCLLWTVKTVIECISWGWNQVKKCEWWAFLFCVIFAIINTFVCLQLGAVAISVCGVLGLIQITFCLVWTVISVIFCLSTANGGTAFLLTDGTVMMQESKAVHPFVRLIAFGIERWWKLTPDSFGSYANGSWSRLADSKLARTMYAS